MIRKSAILVATFLSSSVFAIDPLKYVDPSIGSINSRWFYNAPVSVPGGLIAGGPIDSGFGGYSGGGSPIGTLNNGLHQGFVLIKGFQLGEILILPKCKDDLNFNAQLIKGSEKFEPNYYETKIKDNNYLIKYKVTAGIWTAKFHFEWECKNPIVYISYGNSLGEAGLINESNTHGDINFIGKNFYGYSENKPPYSTASHKTYFYGTSDDDYVMDKKNKYAVIKPKKNNFDLTFALSYTGSDGAFGNYKTEITKGNFNELKSLGQDQWSNELKKIAIVGSNSEKKIFYTSLWNSLRGKSLINDYDGSIPANGKVIHSDVSLYNTDSMWGANFSLIQFLQIFYPKLAVNLAGSLIKISQLYGHIPDGWAINGPVEGMSINTSINYLASIKNYLHVKIDLNYQLILNALGLFGNQEDGYKTEGAESFYHYGYIPLEDFQYAAAANTIELSYSSMCALNLINNGEDSQVLKKSAENYKNIFDIKRKSFVPRLRNGNFKDDFNEMSGSEFAEGNARQYFWGNPYSLQWYMRFISIADLRSHLIEDMEDADRHKFSKNGNVGGYSSLKYNHGNQVALNAVYGFHMLGYPNLSRKYVKKIISKFYGSNSYNGYGNQQDEDQGQLSAWYLMASIGMYDYFGGCDSDPVILLIPPLFKSVDIKTDNLKIKITNNVNYNNDNFKVYIDGKIHDSKIKFSELKSVKNILYTKL